MASKRTAAPTRSTDDFSAWVARTVPDGVHVDVIVVQTFYRDGGHERKNFHVHVYLSHAGNKIDQASHNLQSLARWVTDVAIPVLFPPPQRPLRKLTVESKKLTYQPVEPLFD